ncbi:MAG: hypothetical protein AAGJ37_07390 [Pseudomonadota bacterium]
MIYYPDSTQLTVDLFLDKLLKSTEEDLSSGASELTLQILLGLANYADYLKRLTLEANNQMKKGQSQPLQQLIAVSNTIKQLRPSMAPVNNAMTAWQLRLESLSTSDNTTFIENAKSSCMRLVTDIKEKQERLTSESTRALCDYESLMTFSRSSAIHQVLIGLKQRPLRVFVCESRPGYEGRTLAEDLAKVGIDVEFIIDAAVNHHMPYVNAVVVGADSILADGNIVNKCGTSLLALSATFHKRPFYVIADSYKQSTFTTTNIVLEQMPTDELQAPYADKIHPHNVYFDITDASLITGYISEEGISKNPY